MGSDDSLPSHPIHKDITNLMKASTSDSIIVPRDLLEKLYLSPPTTVKGSLRRTFANPTPVPLAALAICTFCLGCDLMEWRGAGGDGAASIPAFLFIGGVVQIVGAIMEWVLGNTFSFEVFMIFGGFFMTLGGTLLPQLNAAASYSPDGSYTQGLASSKFSASFGFFAMAMTVVDFVFLLCSLRTNIALVLLFFVLDIGFGLVAGLWWESALGHMERAHTLQVGGGACIFVVSLLLTYLFIALSLQAVDFPFEIPVGDLSWMPSSTSRREARQRRNGEHAA